MQQIECKGKQRWNLPLLTVWPRNVSIRYIYIFKIYIHLIFDTGFSGNEKIVELLVKYGANINEMMSNRWLPLSWSIENGNEKVVQVLIDNGANVNQIGIEDKTPLHYAAERGYDAIAEQLIQNGANVNEMQCNGPTTIEFST